MMHPQRDFVNTRIEPELNPAPPVQPERGALQALARSARPWGIAFLIMVGAAVAAYAGGLRPGRLLPWNRHDDHVIVHRNVERTKIHTTEERKKIAH